MEKIKNSIVATQAIHNEFVNRYDALEKYQRGLREANVMYRSDPLGNLDDEIKKAETFYDRTMGEYELSKAFLMTSDDLIRQLDLYKEQIIKLTEDVRKDDDVNMKSRYDLSNRLTVMYSQKQNNELKTAEENHMKLLKELEEKQKKESTDLEEKQKKEKDDMERKYQQDKSDIEKKYNESKHNIVRLLSHRLTTELEPLEMKQIEEWTNKKCGEVVFNTLHDDWSVGSTVINSKLEGRSQLLFLTEDTDNNKFGYYLNTRVEPGKYDDWVPTDDKAFTFSLKSSGRCPGMMKFELLKGYYGHYKGKNTYQQYLFFPGYDFYIGRKERPDLTLTRHDTSVTNFHGIENPLTGKIGVFTPRWFIVIQMY